MLNLPHRSSRIHWLMNEEFEQAETEATLFVPNFLTAEGREDYTSIMRHAILQRDEEWMAAHLIEEGLVAAAEAPAREGGSAARPVSPQAIQALVRGEFNRLYCLALSRTAIEDDVPELEVYRAEVVGNSTSEVSSLEGKRVQPRELLAALRTATLDAYLGLAPEHRQAVLSVRIPWR